MARPEALCQAAVLVGLMLVAGRLGPVQAQERTAIVAQARVVTPANRQALDLLRTGLIVRPSSDTLSLAAAPALAPAPVPAPVPALAAPWASVRSQWGPRSVILERRGVLLVIIDFPHN